MGQKPRHHSEVKHTGQQRQKPETGQTRGTTWSDTRDRSNNGTTQISKTGQTCGTTQTTETGQTCETTQTDTRDRPNIQTLGRHLTSGTVNNMTPKRGLTSGTVNNTTPKRGLTSGTVDNMTPKRGQT